MVDQAVEHRTVSVRVGGLNPTGRHHTVHAADVLGLDGCSDCGEKVLTNIREDLVKAMASLFEPYDIIILCTHTMT